MSDKKLIAEALLEIAQRSETTFLEVSSEDKELIAAAEKIGLVIPSPDLSVMKTVYAEIDKVNLNGVVLPRKAVEKGIQTLIGKQCNWEHDGAGFVCGYTISAKINGDEIETINVLFKSLFPDQIEELKEKMVTKEAAVSFEIWNVDPQTKESVVTVLDNGFREISSIIFHGTGVLLTHQPACPKAKIFKLVAKKEITDAEKIVDKIFSEDLIFAQLAIEEPKCKNCGTCNCGKEGEKLEEIKKDETALVVIPEVKIEEQKDEAKEKLCSECKQPLKEGETDLCAECLKKKNSASTENKPEETKPAEVVGAETKPAETKVEVKVEGQSAECLCVEEEKPVKVISEYTSICVDTYDEVTGTCQSESRGHTKTIRFFKDGREEVSESDNNALYDSYVQKYTVTPAELEEKVNLAKAEKDAELAALRLETETKDNEIKTLKQELGTRDQEIAELKTPKVEVKKEKILTVGEVVGEKVSDTTRRAGEINNIIAGKKIEQDKEKKR
jgi:hypothetical protein